MKFLGWVEPKEFWPTCDIALLTSDNEAQPIALIEAASYGLPLIAEDVGSVSDVLTNNENGFLVNNDQERSNALEKLISDLKLRESMGSTAAQSAQKLFSREQFITAHESAYQAAITAHKAR